MAGNTAIVGPNQGLYYGLDPLLIPEKGLQDGRNFRIKQGRLSNLNLGWQREGTVDFGGPVLLIDTFKTRVGTEFSLVCTPYDIFLWDQGANSATYLTPTYAVGTVDVTDDTVTVDSGTPNWVTNGIKAGDKIHFGSAAQNSPTATWYTVETVDGEGQITLTASVAGGPLSAQTYTIRRLFSGTSEDLWDSAVFVAPDDGTGDDLWFATNGVDWVVSWDGATSTVTVESALGIKARRLCVYKNMMIYANVTQVSSGEPFITSIINSDVGKPRAAGDAGTGLSEQFRVSDDVEPILEVESLGDNLVIYTSRNVTLAQFVGDPLVFIFREVASGIGPIAPRAVANFGDYHEFIGTDSQYLFDGVTAIEVNQHVWREVLRLRDASRIELAFHAFDEEYGDLIWAVPLTSDAAQGTAGAAPEEAFVEHYLEETGGAIPAPFSRRAFPFLCVGGSVVASSLLWSDIAGTWEDMVIRWSDSFLFGDFPLVQAGTENGQIMELGTIQTGGGAQLPSYVWTGRRATGDGVARNLIARIYPFASQFDADLTVTLHLADHAGGAITISDGQTFDQNLNEGEFFTSHFRAGRYMELQFSSPGSPWELRGWDLDVRPGGRR